MAIGPQWITSSGFLFTFTELVSTSTTIIASGTNVIYKLISGNLPNGMTCTTTGTIFGNPPAVLNTLKYTFVIRASSTEGISDRTFSIDIAGQQPPTWSTASGFTNLLDYNTSTAYLKLGPIGEKYALNKQFVNYKFSATPSSAPIGTTCTFYIPENGGILPAG